MNNELCVLGAGKMGSALIRSLYKEHSIRVFDISAPNAQALSLELKKKITVAPNISHILNSDQPIILCVKPKDMKEVVSQIKNDRLIISIAAGVSLGQMNLWRKKEGPIIRVMPNTPIQIGMGMSCLMGNSLVTQDMMESVKKMFAKNGEVLSLNDEDLFHTVTALSGSGPALVYLFLQSLEDAGVRLGLSRGSARKLATQTTLGSAKLVGLDGRSPQDMIHDVTSPGGTTIEAITSLKKNGFENAIGMAVQEAAGKSRKLIS